MNPDDTHSLSMFFPMVMSTFSEPVILVIEFVIFCLCVGTSALFSGSETALTSMSKLRIKRMFADSEESYNKLEPWLHDPNRFLATILVGNNFVNILASVLSAHLFQTLLKRMEVSDPVALGSSLAVAFTTFVLLVFGEILPKTFSKDHAPMVSLFMIGFLDKLYRLLRPIIGIFLFISNTLIRIAGGHTIKELPLLTEEDVRTLIEVSEREGLLESDERDMIHSIIDFGDRTVKEIMTPRANFQAIPVDMPVNQVVDEIVRIGKSRIPVHDGDYDHILGILYAKDFLTVDRDDPNVTLQSLVRPPLFIPNTKMINDLLKMFRAERTHIAIVVDEYGTTDGLVTIEDVLEEIVGDIQDEYDTEEPEFEVQENGIVIALGSYDLEELMDLLEVELPEEDVETVGGFISKELGYVPKTGEEMTYDNVHFTVLDADERKINKVQIVKLIPIVETDEEKQEEKATQSTGE